MAGHRAEPSVDDGPATHAGGVVYDKSHDAYLLVRASSSVPEWVLPKGHIEPGETPLAAALREVQEESGVVADLLAPLGRLTFVQRGKRVAVDYFLLRYVRTGRALESRETCWLPLAAAQAALSHAENREMLVRAERRRTA